MLEPRVRAARRRAAHRRLARDWCSAASISGSTQHIEKLLGPLLEARKRRRARRHRARPRLPDRPKSLGVLERSRVADDVKSLDQDGARRAAQARACASARYHLYRAGAAEARAARARRAIVGAQARRPRSREGPRRSACISPPRAAPRSPADKEVPRGLYPRRRLPRLRRARRARRYSRTARRPDPSGHRLPPRRDAGRAAGGRRRWRRLRRHRRHDLARGLLGRGFRLDPASRSAMRRKCARDRPSPCRWFPPLR